MKLTENEKEIIGDIFDAWGISQKKYMKSLQECAETKQKSSVDISSGDLFCETIGLLQNLISEERLSFSNGEIRYTLNNSRKFKDDTCDYLSFVSPSFGALSSFSKHADNKSLQMEGVYELIGKIIKPKHFDINNLSPGDGTTLTRLFVFLVGTAYL